VESRYSPLHPKEVVEFWPGEPVPAERVGALQPQLSPTFDIWRPCEQAALARTECHCTRHGADPCDNAESNQPDS
jgi:hypothetical protein